MSNDNIYSGPHSDREHDEWFRKQFRDQDEGWAILHFNNQNEKKPYSKEKLLELAEEARKNDNVRLNKVILSVLENR